MAGTITPAEALGRVVGDAESALDESPGKAPFMHPNEERAAREETRTPQQRPGH